MSKKKATRNARSHNKTDEPKRLKDGNILGNVNEPGSARHDTPPVNGVPQTNEFPRG